MGSPPGILFTAFEPSGDEHAAIVIRQLRKVRPEWPIFALGGEKMAQAGAELIENTTQNAVIGAGALAKVREHRATLRRLAAWLDEHPMAAHVPTDSPAANWAICKMAKARDMKVAHLVAPQVWAWASWRVRRLQKWSDLVLCVLPFETEWFAEHDVEAKFIGHPLYDHALDTDELRWQSVNYPSGEPKIALLPGSRPGELKRNWPVMRATFEAIRQKHPNACAVVAVRDKKALNMVRAESDALPEGAIITAEQTDAVIQWADVVLVTSGTATLHVTRQNKPMVALYATSAAQWHGLGRWMIKTRTFTLPNLIACGGIGTEKSHVIKELVPYLGGTSGIDPIVEELVGLLGDSPKREQQIHALQAINDKFGGHLAGREATEAILQLIEGK